VVRNILFGAPAQQHRLLNLFRWFGNELQIPLVGVGTAEALRAVQSDDQLANRFEPHSRYRLGSIPAKVPNAT
jgi:hypothetical protein